MSLYPTAHQHRHHKSSNAASHFHLELDQDLRFRLPGAEGHRPRDPQGRDLRAARAQRRRQDHADQHRLRHRHARPRAPCSSTATTSCATTARARSKIGLVPQELTTDAFETVWATVSFSRGLFGRAPNPAHIEKVLRDLSLWDKRNDKIMTLSGGMKRRVMIAKALAHEPEILFLDEPTAGVDVELRRDMWALVRRLRDSGVTIILTTHYIEEAEEMADRIGVINKGELILVEEKAELMKKLGKKQLTLHLQEPLAALPLELSDWRLALKDGGTRAGIHLRRQRGAHRHPDAAASGWAISASASRT